jgi:predicted cupin superfamily sugar epimerase
VVPPGLERIECLRLAPVGASGRPTHTVPAGWWQTARPLGDYALVGCTVGPGFEYEDFRLLAHDRTACEKLRILAPEVASLL